MSYDVPDGTCSEHGHSPHRVLLNDRDDLTKCRHCGMWITVHADVRRPRSDARRRR
jgi:uncharacterized Zn finger protein